MVEDMEHYHEASGATHFLFITTALPALKAKEVSTLLIDRELPIRWGANIRYEDKFTDAILRHMAESGCLMLNVGLESGSDRIVALMKKGFTIAQAEAFHERARHAGIRIGLYIMLGFPGETDADLFAERPAGPLPGGTGDYLRNGGGSVCCLRWRSLIQRSCSDW